MGCVPKCYPGKMREKPKKKKKQTAKLWNVPLGITYGTGAGPLSPEHAPSVQAWHAFRHLLPAVIPVDRIHANICFPTQRGRWRVADRSALARPASLPVLYTKPLMLPVKSLGPIASAQAPIKPSASTCDKDGHLYS